MPLCSIYGTDVDSDSNSDIYLFDHIITNILHNYQFYSEYKKFIGQGDFHKDNDMSLAWRPPWWYTINTMTFIIDLINILVNKNNYLLTLL